MRQNRYASRSRMVLAVLLLTVAATGCRTAKESLPAFMTIDGVDLRTPDGEKFLIRGTNLGNWLNPEGYMFGFRRCNSAHFIDEMFCQLVGPAFTAQFWKEFKDNYITEEDIRFIASTGANTIRLPLHYKLFTDEDYMGLDSRQDGFARVDSVVGWCRRAGLYLILDMHDAPGGQTGDNIDDSYGYPWLFDSEEDQQLLCDIWRRIALRYRDEPVVMAYELINEPIPHFFDDKERLNAKLEPLYKRLTAAIREVDTNHIIVLGGAQWNSNFDPLTDWTFDDRIIYSCHRYGGEATEEAIRSFIDFRDATGLPMFMGEIGHNTNEWMSTFRRVMEANNIGWTYWPYKKLNNSCFLGIVPPENWQVIVDFAEAPRGTYAEIRAAAPDREVARQAMLDYLEAIKFSRNVVQTEYLEALALDMPASDR